MKKLLSLFVGLAFLLVGCSNGNGGGKHYNPYSVTEDEVSNIYKGDKKDFHIKTWYESQVGVFDLEQDDESGVVNAKYRKTSGNGYAHLFTTASGPFADFTYINIRAKGTPGKSIAMRLAYDPIDLEKTNVLGNDVSFSLTEDYVVHTLKVKGTLKTRLDMVNRICIFPELGVAGSSVRGSFTFNDVWFSQEIPEGATWENKGVDSGDTSVTVNGWKTQAWTFYTLYPDGENTGITYSQAAEWAYIEKSVEVSEEEDHNVLNFSFENVLDASGSQSVTSIVFKLSGDVKEHVTEGVEYDYYTYYESIIYVYDTTNEKEVQPGEDGLVHLEIPISNALTAIGNHHENGYRVVILVESRPDDFEKFFYERDGHMIVHDTYCSHKEGIKREDYTQYNENTYVLTDKDGVDKNVTYTNINPGSYWPRLCRHIKTEVGQSVTLTIRNNGEETVKIGIHAGIFSDERSDAEKNNMFFPLYKNNGIGAAGYFEDGEDAFIEAGEEREFLIEVDASTAHGVDASKDKIDVICLLIDNCWSLDEMEEHLPETADFTARSGDIDLVSFEVE
ncbi:MAG: hypothetical protein K5694_05080 [Bacilli bacterium]|nr:hypothetical protein [Bacilli bacterium]